MNILDKILLIRTKQGRSTIELSRANELLERFNNIPTKELPLCRKEDMQKLYDDILSRKWKYHKDKIQILIHMIEFTN